MNPDEYIGSTTPETTAPPGSANWSWWAQNEARNADAFSASHEPLPFCACHSCPSPGVKARGQETLRPGGGEISGTPDVDAADNIRPRPCPGPFLGPRTKWCPVALVIVRHGPAAPLLHRQA